MALEQENVESSGTGYIPSLTLNLLQKQCISHILPIIATNGRVVESSNQYLNVRPTRMADVRLIKSS